MSNPSDVSVITANLVPENLRPHFLPRHLGSLMLKGEFLVYGWLEQLSKDYSGGLWNFYDLSNGGFYIAPSDEKRFKIDVSGNYFSGEMSADAAGIVASLFAQCDLANRYGDDKLINQYHWLRDFAIEHAESDLIMRAID
jgi:Antirestriction protein